MLEIFFLNYRIQVANMSFKILSLILVSLSFVLMDENGTRENTKNLRVPQRRYSEGTLASDYSRTLDNMLKKNFVEWLLNRREHRIDNSLEPSKREAGPPVLGSMNQGTVAGSQEATDLLIWILQNTENQSTVPPKGSDDWKAILRQEFLSWLISADLCRPMTQKKTD
uniref:Gastric inhibitory polypeptide n=2 Tax=Pogona vitticeps TaxID=103695 RepID=A0ABM5GS46_9SAUR